MNTQIITLNAADPEANLVEQAARVLRDGGLVVVPTETVYGIAADAGNPEAVAKLRTAKGRPDTKPLPVMASGFDDIERLSDNPPAAALALARAFWPGPLTLVVSAAASVGPAIHCGHGTVGLRMPDNRVAQAILDAAGRPLALTSANLTGAPDATTAAEALAALNGRVDLVVDAGPANLGKPSTVVDLSTIPTVIRREGSITPEQLRPYLDI
jgi:L-threonylcarbamoyladenylate synthase